MLSRSSELYFSSVTRCEQLSVSLNVYGNHDLLMTTLIVFNPGRSVEWCDTFCLLHRKTTLFPSIILYCIVLYCIFLSPPEVIFSSLFQREEGNTETSIWERAVHSRPKYTCPQLRTVWNFIIKDLFGGKSFVFIFLYVCKKAWNEDGPQQLFTLGCVDEFLRSFQRLGFTRKSKAEPVGAPWVIGTEELWRRLERGTERGDCRL